MEAQVKPGVGTLVAAFCVSLVALLLIAPAARAGVDGQCPAIADKPDSVPHVDYTGVQHKTYCYGPITIKPGQNTIKYRNAIDGNGTKLWPQQPGYITRFDPELILADGSVPPVDVAASPPRRLGRSTATRSLPSARRRRSSSSHRGSGGGANRATAGFSTTCCTTWSPSRLRSTSSGGSTSSRIPRPMPPRSRLCRPSGWTSPGTRASIRSSTRCGGGARAAPTRSPTRRRRRTSSRADSAAGTRAPTVASGPPRAGLPTRT